MARDMETIQTEIERAREGLALAVDELTTRLDPQRVLNEGKSRVRALWGDPRVKAAAVAAGSLVAWIVVRKVRRFFR